jgi:hypothetical protein
MKPPFDAATRELVEMDGKVYQKGNDLGGKQYSPAEEQLLQLLTNKLKARDKSHFPEDHRLDAHYIGATRPRDYIPLYVKAAGMIYETARALAQMTHDSRRLQEKGVLSWIETMTDFRIYESRGVEAPTRAEAAQALGEAPRDD